MSNLLKSWDSFGEPVTLNYQGDSAFKTSLGGCFSIALKVFMTVYAAQTLLKVLDC